MTNALCLDTLTIADAGGRRLVDGISLTVPTGSIATLVGETGGGKSLIADAILGLLAPGLSASGTITLGGLAPCAAADRSSLRRAWRSQVMVIPQEPARALDPIMRVERQMALAGLSPAAIGQALASVDLAPDTGARHAFTLSGGMAQRVLVATALGVGAPLLVADEPTKGLDDARVHTVIAWLRRAAASGRAVLVITHDRRVARALDGSLTVLKAGQVVEQGPTAAVLASPRTAYARQWLEAAPTRRDRRPMPAWDASEAPLLSASGLCFGWSAGRALFQNLTLSLSRGRILGVTGPSGVGKSTLGNLLLGLMRPTAGDVCWQGRPLSRDQAVVRHLRQRYQKLHQDPGSVFAPDQPVGRQLVRLARVRPGLDPALALPPLLDQLKVKPDLLQRSVTDISGGEAQRLALARLLLLDPAVIIADEPTSRLDPITQRDLLAVLTDLVDRQGLSLMLIGHDQSLLRAITDDVIALSASDSDPAPESGPFIPSI